MKKLIVSVLMLSACATAPTHVPDLGFKPVDRSVKPLVGWVPEYTEFAKQAVPARLAAVKHVDFCPGYAGLNTRAFWAELVKSTAKPESGFMRTEQYIERTMGIDPVTGKQIVSEGLLQLSYQDAKNYRTPYCSLIDWTGDKNLPLAERAITDPYVNIGCGLEIMDRLIAKYPNMGAQVVLGKYWSTIRKGSALVMLKSEIEQCR